MVRDMTALGLSAQLTGLLGAPYNGLVANRCSVPSAFSATHKYWQGELWIQFTDDVTNPVFTWPNWWVNTTGETASGGTLTMTAALEDLSGTLLGTGSGSAASGDNLPITLPGTYKRGVWYGLRYWANNPAGMLYTGGSNFKFSDHTNGDSYEFSATALTDKTATGAAYSNTDVNSAFAFPPVAISGRTRRPSGIILGDSRQAGLFDTVFSDRRCFKGPLARALGNLDVAFANYARSSEKASDFIAAGSRRAALANQYGTFAPIGYGINDVSAGASAATIMGRLETIAASLPQLKVFLATVSPVTTGTWADASGQTLDANNSIRVALNALIRGSRKVYGIADIAAITEDQANAGKWATSMNDGSRVALTTDGVHENTLACILIARSLALPPHRLGR